jgi:hypothetical protein
MTERIDNYGSVDFVSVLLIQSELVCVSEHVLLDTICPHLFVNKSLLSSPPPAPRPLPRLRNEQIGIRWKIASARRDIAKCGGKCEVTWEVFSFS